MVFSETTSASPNLNETERTTTSVSPEGQQPQNHPDELTTFLEFETTSDWSMTRVLQVCQSEVEARRALFGVETISGGGLHESEIVILELLAEKINYLSPEDQFQVWRAVGLALKAHALIKRKSGEPYGCHPLMVVLTLADFKIDAVTLAIGALHDTIEDCTTVKTRPQFVNLLATVFGTAVLESVNLVTKLQDIRKLHEADGDQTDWILNLYDQIGMTPNSTYSPEAQIDELYRLQLALLMAPKNGIQNQKPSDQDLAVLRAVVVKLADRLHNMKTLGSMSAASQQANSLETRDIYVKLAKRLGLWSIAETLADLSAYYLEPTRRNQLADYQMLSDQLEASQLNTTDLLSTIVPTQLSEVGLSVKTIIPNAAAMLEAGVFVTVNIGIPEKPQINPESTADNLEFVATELIDYLKKQYGYKKSLNFPHIKTLMRLIKTQTLNTITFTIPINLAAAPRYRQLRINLMPQVVFDQENQSLLPLIQPQPDSQDQVAIQEREAALEKWRAMQKQMRQTRNRYKNLFSKFSSSEVLLAMTQRVQVGMMLVVGSPPVNPGEKRRHQPWLLPLGATIKDYIESIDSLKQKTVTKVEVNGMLASDLQIRLLPFDQVVVFTTDNTPTQTTTQTDVT
ncbi:MAG TPA: hypothetical protein DEP87_03350 [Candidatus Pacebacteria bacterium]|nr:hypothetical protein [Candidatus Paceibacterota bacterium]